LPAALPVAAEIESPPDFEQVPAAEAALEQAQDVLSGTSMSGLSPTLALRDLALRQHELEGDDRRTSEALLARPNGGNTGSDIGLAVWKGDEANASELGAGCSTDPATPVCVHWTNQGVHAPPAADANDDNVPDWVETTLAEMENVWRYEIGTLGYRPPLTDERASIDDDGVFFDVYLSDIGSRGYYGYCTIDDSRTRSGYDFNDYAGYCVLDNNFSRSEFPTNSPIENLQVTAAHEFFHAIQFAYDAREDAWFMEGTAAWMEDEVYDGVNDNYQYLRTSQFKNPERPLDGRRSLEIYGSWGFFRYLSETLGSDVVRGAWERADAAQGGPDDYSLKAMRRATNQAGADLTRALGLFGLAIAEPKAFLSEGRAYPSARAQRFTLQREGASTQWQRHILDHTSYAPIELRPGRDVRGDARLSVRFVAPSRSASPEVYVLVVKADGSYGRPQRVDLTRRGFGSANVAFGPRDTRRVIVSLGNTSTDFRRCFSWTTSYSCRGGVPEHDDKRFWFKAAVR
jgi:hypothetical protein